MCRFPEHDWDEMGLRGTAATHCCAVQKDFQNNQLKWLGKGPNEDLKC